MTATGGGPDGSGNDGACSSGQSPSAMPTGSERPVRYAGKTSFDADTEPLVAQSTVSGSGKPGGSATRWRRASELILNRYPELPPSPQGWLARVSLALVALMAAAYAIFFSAFLFAQQDAWLTSAEDTANMDQALWNTLHGAILHQTVCNIISDTNCLGDVSRFAIHFEPIMLLISLLYIVIPSPKTIMALQAIVVAAGAFPTYWIASRKLRSSLAGVAFALIYLLYPSLQAAVIYPFHAVTLGATFLMFAFYFMLTRNNKGLFIASILVMSTKEEAPLTIFMIALSIMFLQRRWKVGGWLAAISVAWVALAEVVIHFASPVGQSSTASRYADALHHPLLVIHSQVLGPDGIFYFRTILSPSAYLPLLSPLTFVIAVPEMLINLLSSDPSMRAGIYHYNALIVPVLVFATIQTVATLAGLTMWLVDRAPSAGGALAGRLAQGGRHIGGETWERLRRLPYARAMMVALTLLTLFFSLYEQRERGYTPLVKGFAWPQTTAHAQLADSFLSLIPPDASVCTQSYLAPHLSHRRLLYLYPYMSEQADYVFLDVTSNFYPFGDPQTYFLSVVNLLRSGQYHVVAARDGYLLLQRGSGAPLDANDPYGLPASFYSFAQEPAGATAPHPLDVTFGSSLHLVGYDVSPAPTLYLNNPYLTVTTYWRVTAPMTPAYHPEFAFTRQDGSEYVYRYFPTSQWLPITNWRPGATYMVRSWPLFLTARERGNLRLGVRIAQGAPTDGTLAPLTASVANDSAQVTLLAGDTVAAFYNEQVSK